MKKGKIIVLFSLFAMNVVDQPTPEVKIKQGILRGKISKDGSFYEYLGIPYAATNNGARFKAPLPPPHWEGVFEATDEIYSCLQDSPVGVIGTEDCLRINVYVPAMADGPLPVMVYVHGGLFVIGSGGKTVYAPEFLLKHEVIVVTFNYRLGALGFLCLGIKEAPGNAGLKDQVAALKWIKKNIGAFGGDPDNVTIFGHSSGGASVSLLLASKMTDGFFKRAIELSGSSLSPLYINRDPVFVASKIARTLGYVTEDPIKLYELFSKLSLKDLIRSKTDLPFMRQLTEGFLHLPCVEKKYPGVESFLTDLPHNLLISTSKNISLMIGSTNKEGLLKVSEDTEESLKNKNHNILFYDDLFFTPKEEKLKVAEKLKEYYFGSEHISANTIMNLSQFYTDIFYEMPMLLEAEIMSKRLIEKPFIYYFTYSGGRNMMKDINGFIDEPGACHGDELLYIFKAKFEPLFCKKEDGTIIKLITTLITNFAKYGHPTPQLSEDIPVQWLPSNEEELRLLYLDKELKMGSIPQPEAFKFWKNIFTKYRYEIYY